MSLRVTILLPKEGTYNEYGNLERLVKVKLLLIFDMFPVPPTDNSYNYLNTESYQDHIVCSYDYKLVYMMSNIVNLTNLTLVKILSKKF